MKGPLSPEYAPNCNDTLVVKPEVTESIKKGTAGPALQAEVAVAKYEDHLPLYRQEQRFARMGVPINRSTLCGWLNATSLTLRPLYDRMHELLLLAKIIATDDTPVKVLDRNKKKNIKTIVSSNNFQELIDTFVEKRHLVFDFVLGFEDGFEKGPHHFEATMKKFSLNPSDILFVGDSLHDGERALEANIDFVGKEGTFSTAEFHARFPHSPVVANIDQLLNLLD